MIIAFKSQFADKVRDGTKRQTIRPVRKDGRMRVGVQVSLRTWTGPAYRSKTIILRECEVIKSVTPVRVEGLVYPSRRPGRLYVEGKELMDDALNEFAIADGFKDAAHMFSWFSVLYTLPFDGHLIKW